MRELVQPVLIVKTVSHDEAHERQRRGSRQLLLARATFFMSVYIVSAILARKLGAVEYGTYGVVISLIFWLEMLVRDGLPGATAKLMADGQYDHREIGGSIRALLLSISLLLFTICWFLAPQAASLMRIPNGGTLLRLGIIDLPFAAIYASYDGVLYGHRKFGVIAIAQVFYSMTKVSGVVALISLGFSLERVLVINVLSTCLVSAALMIWYRPGGFRPTIGIVAELVKIGTPMALYIFAIQILMNLDLWSLNSLWEGDRRIVGQYVASMNLAKVLSIIPAAQGGVLFTSVAWAVASRNMVRARDHIQEATRFAVVIAAGACAVIVLEASEVLSVLFSSAYAEGRRFLPLQLAGFSLFGLLDVFSISLLAAGRRWMVGSVLFAMIPLVWLSNYLLIPWIGPIGAATSLLIGMACATGVTGAIVYRHFGPVVRCSTMFRVLVAVTAVTLVSAVIPARAPLVIVKLALLGALYLLVLHASGEITGKDLGLPLKRIAEPSGDAF